MLEHQGYTLNLPNYWRQHSEDKVSASISAQWQERKAATHSQTSTTTPSPCGMLPSLLCWSWSGTNRQTNYYCGLWESLHPHSITAEPMADECPGLLTLQRAVGTDPCPCYSRTATGLCRNRQWPCDQCDCCRRISSPLNLHESLTSWGLEQKSLQWAVIHGWKSNLPTHTAAVECATPEACSCQMLAWADPAEMHVHNLAHLFNQWNYFNAGLSKCSAHSKGRLVQFYQLLCLKPVSFM